MLQLSGFRTGALKQRSSSAFEPIVALVVLTYGLSKSPLRGPVGLAAESERSMNRRMVSKAARFGYCLTFALSTAAAVGCAESGAVPPAAPAATPNSDEPSAGSTPTNAQTHEANVVGQSVTYEVNGTPFVSYVAYDAGRTGRRPGILVVPEWWGQNEYARTRARQLAAAGYVAIAVDMYGEGKVTTDPNQAQQWASAVYGNLDQAQARFVAAKEQLLANPATAPDDISAIGYCFGGGISLAMARRGLDLDGVVSFHGNLATETPAQPGVVKAKVLVLTGEADPMVPATQVAAFEQEMSEAHVPARVISYPGATHAFTNPEATELGKTLNMPVAYHAEADAKSWAELTRFLSERYPNE